MNRGKAPSPWWRDGLYFSCTKCGLCCGGAPGTVRFSALERSAMACALGIFETEFDILYTWKKYGVVSLREKPNYDCIFLKTESGVAGCGIYETRPAQCRSFPFWPEVMKNRRSWDDFTLSCPGMNNGLFHGRDEINEILDSYLKKTAVAFL
ncbi:MAG: YkgJ family cysteine cluster protein [Synergistaceae bacterium]|jgi:Fe-S-cluster containining protein|nr:YkgJ family cysteine cluster protein [Synergistaceae bacterium]